MYEKSTFLHIRDIDKLYSNATVKDVVQSIYRRMEVKPIVFSLNVILRWCLSAGSFPRQNCPSTKYLLGSASRSRTRLSRQRHQPTKVGKVTNILGPTSRARMFNRVIFFVISMPCRIYHVFIHGHLPPLKTPCYARHWPRAPASHKQRPLYIYLIY